MSNSHDKDPFDGTDVEDAAIESFYVRIDLLWTLYMQKPSASK